MSIIIIVFVCIFCIWYHCSHGMHGYLWQITMQSWRISLLSCIIQYHLAQGLRNHFCPDDVSLNLNTHLQYICIILSIVNHHSVNLCVCMTSSTYAIFTVYRFDVCFSQFVSFLCLQWRTLAYATHPIACHSSPIFRLWFCECDERASIFQAEVYCSIHSGLKMNPQETRCITQLLYAKSQI